MRGLFFALRIVVWEIMATAPAHVAVAPAHVAVPPATVEALCPTTAAAAITPSATTSHRPVPWEITESLQEKQKQKQSGRT